MTVRLQYNFAATENDNLPSEAFTHRYIRHKKREDM